MKKLLSAILATAMVLSLLSGVVMFGSAAEDFTTIQLKGVQSWTQAELDASSGNNGYANSVFCSMTVEKDAKYLAGDATQAIKCTYGGSGAYNSCLVNWKYGGGPLHGYSIWAPADGSKISTLANYDGLRIAIRDAAGNPAKFTKIEFRVTQGWNYSNNMWKAVVENPEADEDGFFSFPYSDFVTHGTPPVTTSFTDYLTQSATGISMLCYGGAAQTTTYYSDFQAYKGDIPSGGGEEPPVTPPDEPEEAEELRFPIPGFDQFTADEIVKLGVNQTLDGASMTMEKDGDGHTVFTGVTSSVADWGSYKMSVSSATHIDQWAKNGLINGKSFFGDVDISNKTGLYIKIISLGENDYMKLGGKNAVVLGSSTQRVAIDLKNPPITEDGYFHHDLTKSNDTNGGYQVVGTSWYCDCPDISNTYYGVVDQVLFNMWYSEPNTEFKFRVEAYVAAYTDTTELAKAIDTAKAYNLDEALILEAMELYLDKMNTSQEKVDAMVAKINGIIESAAAERTDLVNKINDALDQADMLGMFEDDTLYYETVTAADLMINGSEATIDDLRYTLGSVRAAIAAETMDGDLGALMQKCQYLWKYNYTEESIANCRAVVDEVWDTYEEDEVAALAKLQAAYDALVPIKVIDGEDSFFDGWETADVNDVVDINNDKLCGNIGDGLNRKDVWNGGDFSVDTAFEAGDGWFSMTALTDFFGAAIGWKNLDRSGTLAGTTMGAYPALNVVDLSEADGIRFKMDLGEGGHVDRVLIGLSNCCTMNKEDYAIQLHPYMVGKDGYINVPFSYFEHAWWTSEKFAQSELDDVCCFIVEAFNVSEDTVITISDVHGYTVDTTVDFVVPDLWEYNYTADSWAAYQEALKSEDTSAIIDAIDKLVLVENIVAVTGNLFDGWTTKAINDVVTANSDKLGDSVLGEGLDTAQDVWKNCDFTNNTEFSGDNSFAMKATASFEGKTMCWKNMDRSGTLAGTANHGYPALNLDGILDSDGIRVKLTVDGEVTRILLGFSNCAADSGMKGSREMYALNITADSVASDGYVTIPWSCFGKCWWCDAFAANELDKMEVFIIEAYNATNGTTVSVDDIYGYKAAVAATQEELDELAKAIQMVEDFDFDAVYATKLAGAKALLDGAYDYEVAKALEEVKVIIADYSLDTINRTDLKNNLFIVKEVRLNDIQVVAVMEAFNTYYSKEATQTDIDMAKENIDIILNVPEAPGAPTVLAVSSTAILLIPYSNVEYKMGEDGKWTSSSFFDGLTPNTEYVFYQRIVAEGLSSASESSVATHVFTAKLDIDGDVTIIGDAKYGCTLTAIVELANDVEYTVEWYKDEEVFLGEGKDYVIKAEDIGSVIYAIVYSDEYEGYLVSENIGPVEKGVPKIINNPSANGVLAIGNALSTIGLIGGEADVTGTWAFENPDYIPEFDESGNEFNVIFTPDDSNYETAVVKVRVEISGDVNVKTFTNTELGFSISGEFYDDSITGFETESLQSTPNAYLALLRAAKNSNAENNIIFAYTLKFEKKGYTGTLTLKTNVGEKYAGKTYTVWFFADGEATSAQATVNAKGDIVVEGLVY